MNTKNNSSILTLRTIQKEDIVCNFLLRDNFITGIKSSEHYHFHSFYEFLMVVTGKMHIIIEDNDFFLESGNICIIPPNTIHYILEDEESFRTGFRFSFSRSNYGNTPHFFPRFQKSFHNLHTAFILNDATIYENFLKTSALVIRNQNSSYVADELLFLALDCVSHIISQEPTTQREEYSSDNVRSEYIEDFINTTYHANPKIEDLAKVLNLSKRQTERVIARLFNMTFSELILKKRLTIAKFLLQKTTHTMEEIAFQTGFYDTSHFYHKFTACYGITPAKYREKKK